MDPSKGTVLVVDDDADIRLALTDLLEAEGYRPFEAANGRQALEELQHVPRPCIVLLDLMMPIMDGHEFLKEMRAHPQLCSDVRVVVCSASIRMPPPAPPVGAVLYKPYELGDLMECLAHESCS
jgi:CheY-like chemotaxis protein